MWRIECGWIRDVKDIDLFVNRGLLWLRRRMLVRDLLEIHEKIYIMVLFLYDKIGYHKRTVTDYFKFRLCKSYLNNNQLATPVTKQIGRLLAELIVLFKISYSRDYITRTKYFKNTANTRCNGNVI